MDRKLKSLFLFCCKISSLVCFKGVTCGQGGSVCLSRLDLFITIINTHEHLTKKTAAILL